MIGDSIAFDYNAVTVTAPKVNQDNYGSVYSIDDSATSGLFFTVNVKHTIPPKSNPGKGESHLVRVDADSYDSEGTYLGTHSAYVVYKTTGMAQDATIATRLSAVIAELASDTTLIGKVLGRQS